MTEQQAILLAEEQGLVVHSHPKFGWTMIDGARWDIWLRIRNIEVPAFRGGVLVKEM